MGWQLGALGSGVYKQASPATAWLSLSLRSPAGLVALRVKVVPLSMWARHAPSPAPGCFHTSGPARAAKGCQTRPCPQLCPTAWSPWQPPSTPGETEKVLVSLYFPLEWPESSDAQQGLQPSGQTRAPS